jgi:hypothetical protein
VAVRRFAVTVTTGIVSPEAVVVALMATLEVPLAASAL